MVLLDTNVVSALMQRAPDPAVVAWLDGQPAEAVWKTSITVFEVRTGLELLVSGRRRRQREEAFEQLLAEELAGRMQSGPGRCARRRHDRFRHFEELAVDLVDPWRHEPAGAQRGSARNVSNDGFLCPVTVMKPDCQPLRRGSSWARNQSIIVIRGFRRAIA
jgi:hypothetical protein